MPKIPRITATRFIKIISSLGFSESRQEGSHKIFKNHHGVRVTVPCHGSRTLHPKIIKTFLIDARITLEEFIKRP